jgi:hypothetical protein
VKTRTPGCGRRFLWVRVQVGEKYPWETPGEPYLHNLVALANSVEIGQNQSIWPQPLFLADSKVIGIIAMFGRLEVTWCDMVVLAESRQVPCHLPDADDSFPEE